MGQVKRLTIASSSGAAYALDVLNASSGFGPVAASKCLDIYTSQPIVIGFSASTAATLNVTGATGAGTTLPANTHTRVLVSKTHPYLYAAAVSTSATVEIYLASDLSIATFAGR